MRKLRRDLEHRPAGCAAAVLVVALTAPELISPVMHGTPFPVSPADVVALTVPEFTRELDLASPASLDVVCGQFLNDANRALVWFIRFRALREWCERSDMARWLGSDPAYARSACELAQVFS
jgi:hypothetical protein